MELTLPRPRRWMLVPTAVAVVATVRRRVARARTEADEGRPADVGFMWAMHDAFRRDLDRLEAVAPHVEHSATVPEQVRAGWDALQEALHNHHAAEDDDLWPVLGQHLHDAADRREVDAMVDEHRTLSAALDTVDDALTRQTNINSAAHELAELVRAHLEHEERTVLPLLERHLSRREWRRFLHTERDRRSLRERPAFLGWVLDDASEADRAAVMAELPRPARLVYRLAIRPGYVHQHRWQLA